MLRIQILKVFIICTQIILTDKNLVLQTSAPMKGHQEKNGGTDNPAFLADTNTGDGFMVVNSGLTRIVRVSSSTIDTGSLGIELSTREEGGRKIYMCKHNDGLKGKKITHKN